MTRRAAVLAIAALAALLLARSPLAAGNTAGLRPLRSGSFADLLAAREGKPLLLVMWSVTCAPCRKEFELLGDLRKSHPDLPLVLVSTDGIADREMATAVLARYGLGQEESWIFAESNAARLRYEIDPQWYGEMPRSYFYDAAHRREAVSGSLERARVESWIDSVTGA